MLIIKVLGELGNALGICLRLKLEPFSLKESLKLLVVGNDAIVNDRELPCWI